MAVWVSARAVSGLVRAVGRVRRMACRVVVKEIRPGSVPVLAAASAMTARMTWQMISAAHSSWRARAGVRPRRIRPPSRAVLSSANPVSIGHC